MNTELTAAHIIAGSTGLTTGAAQDIITAASLATAIALPQSVETVTWDEIPLGMGSDLIDFAKSDAYKIMIEDPGLTFGQLSRAYLLYRLRTMGG